MDGQLLPPRGKLSITEKFNESPIGEAAGRKERQRAEMAERELAQLTPSRKSQTAP